VCGLRLDRPSESHRAVGVGDRLAELDAQRQQLAKAADELARAGLAVQEVVARQAAAESASAHRSVAEIDAELDTARHDLAAATLAAAEAETLGVRIAELRTELEQTTSRLEELRATVQATQTQRATIVSELASITERVALHREGFDTVADRAEALRTRLAAVRDFETALLERAEKAAAFDRAQHTLRLQLDEQSFSDAAHVTAARLTASQKTATTGRISAHDAGRAAATATLAEPELRELPDALVELDPAAEARDAASVERDDARVEAGSLADRTSRLRAVVTEALELLEASEALRLEYETLRSLANSVEGAEPNTMRMRLESYVLAAQLEEIIRAANARLAVMTGGRYSLEHDDSVQYRNTRSGLGIAILDQHTGRARATHSLSGGETFLASLALALGLAEVVSNQAGGITLDTLFIDEGFGSLDADTLAIAMSTLDGLRSGGRTIGLISHVEAMKEQIPSRLRITVTPQGFSEIDQRS
jgi:exonuclease SbcC